MTSSLARPTGFRYRGLGRAFTSRVPALLFIMPVFCSYAGEMHGPTTSVPFTYEIDYREGQAEDPAYLQRFQEAPPDLFHGGADLRYLGRFGFGAMVYESRSVSHEQWRETVGAYTRALHERGVRWVIPYLCNQTIAGNDATRYGAWEVYDHWNDFAALGLGPRPPDPIMWMQREPGGRLHYNYKRMCFAERGHDPVNVRYAACPNNPHWRSLCNAEARLAAEAGFDGLFIDNCILHCYCEACEAAFQAYLRRTYTEETLSAAFGTDEYEQIALYKEGDLRHWARSFDKFNPWLEKRYPPDERRIHFDTTGALDEEHVDNAGGGMLFGETTAFVAEHMFWPGVRPTYERVRLLNPALQSPAGLLRWAETQRFWAASIGAMLSEMTEAGCAVKPDFFVIPNWGTMQRVEAAAGRAEDAKNMRLWKPGADWQMYEEDFTTGQIAPGIVLDYDMQLRFAFANGVRAMVLPYNLPGEDIAEVAIAEAAAAGGSVYVATRRYPGVFARYRDFFREHGRLYEGYQSAARIALAHFFDQVHFVNIEHLRQVHALNRSLADQQMLFDHLIEDDCTRERLADYDAIILPQVVYLSDAQVDALSGFAAHGGTLILIGEVGTCDAYARRRAAPPGFGPPERVFRFPSIAAALPHAGIELEPALQATKRGAFLTVGQDEPNASYLYLRDLDQRLGFKRYQDPGPLTGVIARAAAGETHVLPPWAASGVRCHAWRRSEGDAQVLVLHLVNENVPLAVPEPERRVQPVRELPVALPLPADARILSATLYVPGDPERVLSLQSRDEPLVLEELHAYAVIEIQYTT